MQELRGRFITVTKIKQERTIQDRTKIGPFIDFLLHFSMFFLEVLKITSHLSCEAMLKIQEEILKNEGEIRRKDQCWSYLDWSFLA